RHRRRPARAGRGRGAGARDVRSHVDPRRRALARGGRAAARGAGAGGSGWLMARKPAEELRSIVPSLRRIWSFLRPHLRPHRKVVAGGFVALFAEVAFRLLEPWPLKFVIDAVIAPGAAQDPGLVTLLVWAAIAVVAVAGLRAL